MLERRNIKILSCGFLKVKMMKSNNISFLLLILILLFATVCEAGSLRKHFYKKTCPQAENIVRDVIWSNVQKNSALPAKLLRLHFHDCFIRGCDASILLNSMSNNTAEKDAIPNLSLAGFDVIEEVKAELEKTCPETVSCADIIALAARDSVAFQYKKDLWEVRTGRRDGRVSLASEALMNLPSAFANFTELKQNFSAKGLTVHDLVVLSGGHTIGVGHCDQFANRLYNFTGKGDADPTLNPTYAAFLKTKCNSTLSITDFITEVEMDPGSGLAFDVNYYVILKERMGMFQSDTALITNKESKKIVSELTNPKKFFTEFSQSMKRMGKIEVLTGKDGEIRKKCGLVN